MSQGCFTVSFEAFFFLLKWLVCSSISEKVTWTCDSNRDLSKWGKPVAAALVGQKLPSIRARSLLQTWWQLLSICGFSLLLCEGITLWVSRATTESKWSCGSFRTGCYFNELNKSYIGLKVSLEFLDLQSSTLSLTFEPCTLQSSENCTSSMLHQFQQHQQPPWK